MLFDGIVTMLLSSVLENRTYPVSYAVSQFQHSLGEEIMVGS